MVDCRVSKTPGEQAAVAVETETPSAARVAVQVVALIARRNTDMKNRIAGTQESSRVASHPVTERVDPTVSIVVKTALCKPETT